MDHGEPQSLRFAPISALCPLFVAKRNTVMSHIGRAPVALPDGVTVSEVARRLHVTGPKGELSFMLPERVAVRVTGSTLTVERAGEEATDRAMHGLSRALIANMVHGVTQGFSKELEIVGIGYRAQLQGQQLVLTVGFSHPVHMAIPQGVTVEVPKPTVVVVKGTDKYLVGQFASDIRRVAPPEPYKGKGIKYAGEVIRRKAGKAATGTKSA